MTFCRFWTDCQNAPDCSRALTLQVQQQAAQYGLPICEFMEIPECHRPTTGDAAVAPEPADLIQWAMWSPETLAVELTYYDREGTQTTRTVSPIRWLGRGRFLALCLGREHPRQFRLDRCVGVRSVPAEQVFAPVEIVEQERPL